VPRVSPPDGLPVSQIPSQEVAAQIPKINEELAGIKEELRSLKQKIDQQNKTPGPVSSEMAETRKQPAGPRCFMIKAKNYMAINQSRRCGSWQFSHHIANKLRRAHQESQQVTLVFSVTGSGPCQGYAHLKATGQRGTFSIEWKKLANDPFTETRNLLNPLCGNLSVQRGHNGLEIEPKIGAILCSLLDHS